MRGRSLLALLKRAVEEHHLLEAEDSVLVGVSGGPDSVALLEALLLFSEREGLNLRIGVAHLNHCIRGRESDEDEEFVRSLARKKRVRFFAKRVDVPGISRQKSRSLEVIARQERYRFFEEIALEEDFTKVALGHTRDDLTETVLANLIRGTGLEGLSGIPIRRPISRGSKIKVIRPLLFVTRKEVEQFLQEHHLTSRLDSSNLKTDFFRNRIRHRLIPLLEENFNPALSEHISNLSSLARDALEFLEGEVNRAWQRLTRDSSPARVIFPLEDFLSLPDVVKGFLVRRAIAHLTQGKEAPSFQQVRAVLRLPVMQVGSRVGGLPGSLVAERAYRGLIFSEKKKDEMSCRVDTLKIPGRTGILRGKFLLEAKIVPRSDFSFQDFLKSKSSLEEAIDFDRAGGEKARFEVRTRRPGDRFQPLGLPYSKRLKTFFIARKIPRSERDHLPLLLADGEVISVAGFGVSERVKVDESTTRILIVRFIPAERPQQNPGGQTL